MNKRTALVIATLLMLFPTATAVAAASKHEQNLTREAARLDRTASTPAGEKAVVTRLAKDFPVAPERIAALRNQGLGYGEIAAALSCAQSLPGGATNENVDRILTLRQGTPPLGWGAVAQNLGIKLGRCVSQVKKVTNESHREMKKDHISAPRTAAPDATGQIQSEQHRKFEGEGKSLPQGSRAQ
mgnify:CR=1 FL=1